MDESTFEDEQSTINDETAAEEHGNGPLILVIHASVGSGHRSAANSIAEGLRLCAADPTCAIPSNLRVAVIDSLDYTDVHIDGSKSANLFIGWARPFYDIFWRYFLTGRILWGGGTVHIRLMWKKILPLFVNDPPAAVIATHINGANIAAGVRMITGQTFPLVSVPTDYETEGMWPHRETDLFCVASDAMVETLLPRRVPKNHILYTGIPTRDAFRKCYDKMATREKLGLPKDKCIALVLAGAYMPKPYQHFREAIDKVLPYFHPMTSMHLVLVAGSDKDYAQRLRAEVEDLELQNVTVLDYVDEMAELMAACDVAICKAGGLTVTECLCARLPMVLVGKAYGQEKINIEMLTGMGAAVHATTAGELIATLKRIGKNPRSVESLAISGEHLRRPEASLEIAKATWKLVEQGSVSGFEESDTLRDAKMNKVTLDEKPVGPAYAHIKRKKHFLKFYFGGKPAHHR